MPASTDQRRDVRKGAAFYPRRPSRSSLWRRCFGASFVNSPMRTPLTDEQTDTEVNRDGEHERRPVDPNLFEPRDANAWRQVAAGETGAQRATMTRCPTLTAPRPLHRTSRRAASPSADSARPYRSRHRGGANHGDPDGERRQDGAPSVPHHLSCDWVVEIPTRC
jgi:hypothetical protein